MKGTNEQVEQYIASARSWQAELAALRNILRACPLTEEFKWRAPCYSVDGGNVAILGALKDYCTLSFFKGALLADPERILEKPGDNTRSARVVRCTSVAQIRKLAPVLASYLQEAIEAERAGLKVEATPADELAYPAELEAKLEALPALKRAFAALTPGRRRAFVMHFAAAKQSATRTSRIEQAMPRILAGKGPHDCICGHSKKPPGCDGSHKAYQ